MSKTQPPTADDTQQRIVALIKVDGETTMATLAGRLGITYEATRQQVRQLEAAGLVVACRRPNPAGVGRPLCYYGLTPAGDHLFPKSYDELALALIDSVGATLGEAALRQVLAAITEAQVRQWQPQLAGLSLAERLAALRDFYIQNDPFTEAHAQDGDLWLVERNCPFLNVASRRPALCSVTVNSLARLLGYRVSREQRFQEGHGRCLFRVHAGEPLPAGAEFRLEDDNLGAAR
jgi:predicted ArsR family transcriptional regulator